MEYVTLMGTEDVQRAGRQMEDAADKMLRAAMEIEESLTRFLQRWEEAIYPMLVLKEEQGVKE